MRKTPMRKTPMRKTLMRKTLFSLALVGTIATAAIAVGPGVGPARCLKGPLANTPLGRTIAGCFGRVITLRSDLNVTAEQRQQIREVILSHRSEIAATAKSVRDQRVALRDLVRSDQANETQIRAAADALGQAVSDAAVKVVALRGEIAPLLNDAQRATIDKFLMENDVAINAFLDSVMKGS